MNNDSSLFPVEEYNQQKNKKLREEKIQLRVCEYISKRYPHVIFSCDLASGMKLPIFIAARHKKMRSSRGLPDLFIAHPGYKSGALCYYHGLFVELKKADVRLKNGNIRKNPHHDEQAKVLEKLRDMGYRAEFACGYEEAVTLIDEYLQ